MKDTDLDSSVEAARQRVLSDVRKMALDGKSVQRQLRIASAVDLLYEKLEVTKEEQLLVMGSLLGSLCDTHEDFMYALASAEMFFTESPEETEEQPEDKEGN